MNQTKKRLSIINLAISITDIETIQLQIAKLRLIRTDTKIQKIIDALESESYALAQNLIQEYIDTPIQEIHQRVSNGHHKRSYSQRELELIEQFDLFLTDESYEDQSEIVDINQYLQTSAASSKEKTEVDFDKLLDIEESRPEEEEEVYFSAFEEEALSSESDTYLPEPVSTADTTFEDSSLLHEEQIATPIYDEALAVETTDNTTMLAEQATEMTAAYEKALKPSNAQEISDETITARNKNTKYRPIFSIKQQFLDASQKYPLLVNSTQPYDSVTEWIDQISHEHGYAKSDVEKTVINALKLAEEETAFQRSEAAELLLLSGLTEDEFGQLILAREFFKGRLFEKNISEAFKRIEQLASREYPEAICDLAQFYEHGVGTKKNKKTAKELYEKAMHFGIKRAQRHFQRLSKESGLFSF
ncbi:hypothetical protein PGH07_07490 [Sulfurovum sp. zt1-1]|uniref:beta-lactamase n=1 Tax=Sulfurovum zhangzhouensis TaxID=3019067 RepID=A0ABT7QYW6_9BACT|nr:hypothetical protein [Sulfurovum zhangzhouensis]MDM5272018.1 hypothetical protein [Sulfurovum zhangzhouensis]